MDNSSQDGEGKKKITKIKTFPVPFALGAIQENINIATKTPSKPSKEQIINKAFQFHSQGNISEAAKYYQFLINQGVEDSRIYTNYGVILGAYGKLKEAELYQRKAIKLNPNFTEAHSNLGNILIDLGKLKEAELYQRKAIKLNPNLAEAHSTLGDILKNLGKLEEAELSTRKAIKLNPNFAEAYSNLGSILKNIGKLIEAEVFTRKAIKLNPNLAEAHSNLGNILQDLGKSNELLLLSKSTLESKSINQGYKLLALLRIIITHLLKKDFEKTLLNINKTNDLISKGAVNNIKNDQNKRNFLNFFLFITSLFPQLEKKDNNPNLKKVPHLGESHCLSFAHQNLSICSQIKKIQPVLIVGGKAWHFANNKNNRWKDSLAQQIKQHNYNDEILISFGEIDCRKDEGILNYAIKNNKNISDVCVKTVKGYLDYMERILSQDYSKRYYFGVPAPLRQNELLDDLDIKRIETIKIYNSLLKQEVLSRNSYFVDVYALTSNDAGENNNLHMCDDTHLSPDCLSILFEDYLCKSEI